MRSALAIVAIICLVASSSAGCATPNGPRQVRTAPGGVAPTESNWSRVRELVPDTEVALSIKGSAPYTCYFVLTDQSGITVMNLAKGVLPARATRELHDLASHHPEYFAAMQRAGTFGEDDVRVGRDGVFVTGRRVADLGEVVQVIARSDVAEIRGPVVARGSVLGAALGGWVGFAVGVVPGLGGAPDVAAWSALVGSVALGGFLGSHWSSHQAEGIVYRAR